MTRGSIDRRMFTSGVELGGHLIRDINLLYDHFIAGLGGSVDWSLFSSGENIIFGKYASFDR